MTRNRLDEQFALAVVGQLLGAQVEHYDVGGRQGAVDGIVHYPDGRDAALEVSSIGPQDEARIMRVLARMGNKHTIDGLTRTWTVEIPRDFPPRELPRIYGVLLRCEQLGVDELRYLPFDDPVREGLDRRVKAFAVRMLGDAVPDEPRAYFVMPPKGGAMGLGMEPLAAELAAHLTSDEMRENLDKLAATGLEERHLFLHVRPSAFSDPVYMGLVFGDPLPTTPPVLLEGLSQAWLTSGYVQGGIVRAVAGEGWRRDLVADPMADPRDAADDV